MKLKNFLRILIPVCALSTVSCTNEELILDASQTQRGREFAEAFKARFDNIDPNHTWIDGTVGKVMVTTDEQANIVIYGLGRSDNTALRLKRCVVEGTQEVKYDIPMGCKKVVIRAWNEHGDEYKTLDPTNENDEAQLLIGTGTRAASFAELEASGFPKQAQRIPNVWNLYGAIAPWQTDIPHVNGLISIYDPNTYTKINSDNTTTATKIGLSFYFQFGGNGKYYNMWFPTTHYQDVWRDFTNGGISTTLWGDQYTQEQKTSWQNNGNRIVEGINNGQTYFLPACLFGNNSFNSTTDANFSLKTGYSRSDIQNNNHMRKVHIGQNQMVASPFVACGADGKTLQAHVSPYYGQEYYPEGDYYQFEPVGKRGSWLYHNSEAFGDFYVTNIDISDSPTSGNQGGDRLSLTQGFYHRELNGDVIDEIRNIMGQAEDHYEVLRDFNQDSGLKTTLEGPVSVSWFSTQSTTRDYIGYYYTEGDDSDEACNLAPKYLLLEGTCTSTRSEGDTFPLTYYGSNYQGEATYTFPEGVNIHFFIVHGRDSGAKNVNGHWSSFQNFQPMGNDWQGNPQGWATSDPTNYDNGAHTDPTFHGPMYDWLFYDKESADLQIGPNGWVEHSGVNGWTLNAYYACFSHAGAINNMAVQRIYNINDDNTLTPDSKIENEFGGNFKPMVAFKYAGYNVIGFEDTPVEQWYGTDWNDCTFIVNGNFDVPQFKEQDLAFSMCMEDLGGTDDLDYNDLYMIVIQPYQEIKKTVWDTQSNSYKDTYENVFATPKVIVDMVGGILPLKVTFETDDNEFSHLGTAALPQVIFEDVHAAFGDNLSDVAINTVNPNPDHGQNMIVSANGSYEDGSVATVTFKDGAVVKCTRGMGNRTYQWDANNWTESDIANFSIIENIPNFKVYVTYSDKEEVCISGPKNVQVGGEGKEDRIPYAFWFPSTAVSEQESNNNPETRVHPGYERQFIGDYLEGFNEWVADQNGTVGHAGHSNWYNWQWGNNDWYDPSNPGGNNSGQQEEPDTWQKVIYSNNYTQRLNYTVIPGSYFNNATSNVVIRLNYNNIEYHWASGKIGDYYTNPDEVNSGNEVLAVNEPGLTADNDLSSYISSLKEKGITIFWWTNGDSGRANQIPTSIQIHVE